MRAGIRSLSLLVSIGLALAFVAGFSPAAVSHEASAAVSAQASPSQEKGGQEEFGPYEFVSNWPQPLPDGPDGVKHDGWTWGSVGAVYAETPDRIWIAQRGELPLPQGAKPWTPYALLNPSRGNATGNDNGLGATCQPAEKRGWLVSPVAEDHARRDEAQPVCPLREDRHARVLHVQHIV